MKKRAVSLIAALLMCFSLVVSAFAVVEPSESFYCADYANVLSDSTEEMINVYNGALEWECQGAQIVVVTVNYLEGMYCDEYAYRLFNDWGIGSAEYNNGMLLLLAAEENKAWLAYGLGFQSMLSEEKVDRLLDKYFWKDFDAGKYDSAVAKLFKELVKWYDGVYGTHIMGAAGNNSTNQQNNYSSGASSGGLDLIIKIFLLIILFNSIRGRTGGVGRRRLWAPLFFLLDSRNDRGGRGGYGGGFGGGGFHGGSGHGGGGFSGGGGGRR